jgi:predicted membrane protein
MSHHHHSGSIFWGVLLVLLGISVLLNTAFGIHIPFFSLLIAFIFIYFGVRMLLGHRHGWWHDRRQIGDQSVDWVRPGDEHNVVFGRGDFDLTHVVLQDKVLYVEINTVFGASVIEVDSRMPVKVVASSAFGAVHLPDGNATTFGEYSWRSPALDESKPYLAVQVSSVFAGVRVHAR